MLLGNVFSKRLMNDRSIKRINYHFIFSEKALKMSTNNSLQLWPCKSHKAACPLMFWEPHWTKLKIIWRTLAPEETQWSTRNQSRKYAWICSTAFSRRCSISDRKIFNKWSNQDLWAAKFHDKALPEISSTGSLIEAAAAYKTIQAVM